MSKLNLKIYFILLVFILSFVTVFLGAKKPVLHKPLVMNVLDYFVKVNPDNSKTIIEKTTTIENKGTAQ